MNEFYKDESLDEDVIEMVDLNDWDDCCEPRTLAEWEEYVYLTKLARGEINE
jgi:hypothetical protein